LLCVPFPSFGPRRLWTRFPDALPQDPSGAAAYYDRRINKVKGKANEIQAVINSKRKTVESIVMVMQQKIAQISQTDPMARFGVPVPVNE